MCPLEELSTSDTPESAGLGGREPETTGENIKKVIDSLVVKNIRIIVQLIMLMFKISFNVFPSIHFTNLS